ncbi:cation efflux family-domain-containing protein [Catenaria anguillulae PL171]|uniref:Cation efflux family-domain-containing protein n=1 Tax=Catenaria anguillulae PL171 TaxID=765915 RepID=A0A1Y2H8L0_9FUNG|nr:cation efflux family-domain-containing protein [Catenaria anguillulae PL171]
MGIRTADLAATAITTTMDTPILIRTTTTTETDMDMTTGTLIATAPAAAALTATATHTTAMTIIIITITTTMGRHPTMFSPSMSLQSYSLLFLFDLLAIVNEFVSHALSRGLIAPRDPSQYSFGLQRLEVVFAFANSLSLFFSGMYALKEALEVMLEEEDHKHDPTGSYNAVIPIAAAVIGTLAIIRLSIHKPYYKFMSRSRFSEWTTNPFIQAHGLVATILLLVHWTQSIYAASPARTQTHVAPAADALGACAIGLVLMWLATPLAIAMGQILLQVTPAPLVSALQRACGEIASMEGVMQVAKAQYWSNAFNEQVGVIHVQHRSGADPSVVREHVRERLMARVPGDWWIQVEVGQSRII